MLTNINWKVSGANFLRKSHPSLFFFCLVQDIRIFPVSWTYPLISPPSLIYQIKWKMLRPLPSLCGFGRIILFSSSLSHPLTSFSFFALPLSVSLLLLMNFRQKQYFLPPSPPSPSFRPKFFFKETIVWEFFLKTCSRT
jgi:hypothetical protein